MTKPRPHFVQAGFTLVELLVAIAVLAIILVAAGQILGTTASLTTVNNKHMDANDQARTVFDCMADDFSRMVRRRDVDYIFWKNSTGDGTGPNDAMFFYTEGASYFDQNTFNPTLVGGYLYRELEKNSVSLVGYRINNTATVAVAPYYQLERLGKALSWDGQGYNSASTQNASKQPNVEVLLTYPPAGTDVTSVANPDNNPITYSTAFFNSTLAGAFSNNTAAASRVLNTTKGSTVGTEGKGFNDSTDTTYRTLGSQVFRFEYAFQLKDGTMSDKPIMTSSTNNGLPAGNMTATAPPTHSNGATTYSVGSRWWDTNNHIGYVCLDASVGDAIWHEIGIQDVAAIVVTIAVIDKQGFTFVNAHSNATGNMSTIAAALPDYLATTITSTVAGDPSYLLNPSQTTGWAYALLPGNAVSKAAIGSTTLPQPMVSQIRLYQRYFYLNTF
jgi:prepilin-type N-terminal cleavage/methylation domain-containing protein